MTLAEQLFAAERTALVMALHEAAGQRRAAAEELGIAVATLQRKMTRHRLDFPTAYNYRVDQRRRAGWLLGRMSQRQKATWQGLALGKTEKELALDLGISAKTVNYHRGMVQKKLRMYDLASLTRAAGEYGLLPPMRSAGMGRFGRH